MKNLIIIILLFLSSKSFSQEINFCDYFSLEVSESEYNGKKSKSYRPIILKSKKDKFSKFLEIHNNRFEYILLKNLNTFKEIANFYPDTIRIKDEFCKNLIESKEIQNYFPLLTPKKIIAWNRTTDTFTIEEMMLVSSKYFYCDDINKKDTIIQSHICIGINGQKEYKSERDLTLLEAFCFEAIFSYIIKKKDPLFYTEFYAFKKKVAKEKVANFKDFDTYLLEIRNLCYKEMENNKDLKDKILKYYKKNRSNLNFIIE